MSRKMRKKLDADEARIDRYQPAWTGRVSLRTARREAHRMRMECTGAVVIECNPGGWLAGGQGYEPTTYRVRSAIAR